jgi:raffinose/stachyose/melibiose transport system permease protein
MINSRQTSVYLAPALLFTIVFFIFPLVFVIYISLHEWNGLGTITFIGIDNFRYLFHDELLLTALTNTMLWILSGIVLHLPLGLLLALILAKRPKGWKIYRTLFFLPNVISTTALAFLWYFVLHINLGLLNTSLKTIGFGFLARGWLSDPHTALFANQVPFILYVGFTMVIFLTQISTISPDLYEAAEMDGATSLQKDMYITIPMLKQAIGINIIFNTAFCLKMFEYPLLMTGGGPANSTFNLSLYIYKEMITANRYGISMAAGLLTVLAGAISMLLVFTVLNIWNRRGIA